MNQRIEILMPPTDNVRLAVDVAMEPYGVEAEGEHAVKPSWWDWYVIGGRWLGAKLLPLDLPDGELEARIGEEDGVKASTYTLREATKSLSCSRFLVVTSYEDDYRPGLVRFMLSRDIWNGTNYERTSWDGTLGRAAELLEKHDRAQHTVGFLAKNRPQDDWLVVTVQAHY